MAHSRLLRNYARRGFPVLCARLQSHCQLLRRRAKLLGATPHQACAICLEELSWILQIQLQPNALLPSAPLRAALTNNAAPCVQARAFFLDSYSALLARPEE